MAIFSSVDALLCDTENIRKKLNDNENVATAFLDLSKAFDFISHSILLDKLRELNFGNHAVSLIESYLKNRNEKVMLTTCTSDWIQLYQSVPQGPVLGPLLLNMYVKSMRKSVSNNCQLVQYADVTMIYLDHQDENQAMQNLEENVKDLVHFFECHRLTINADKPEFIIFCNDPKQKQSIEKSKINCEK